MILSDEDVASVTDQLLRSSKGEDIFDEAIELRKILITRYSDKVLYEGVYEVYAAFKLNKNKE